MPNCTQKELGFPSFDRRKIEANFAGGDVSSDGGIMLLRQPIGDWAWSKPSMRRCMIRATRR